MWFLEPVDWESLGLTDYLTVVKKPMDLNTVKNKLADGGYSSKEECSDDIRLIWSNAMLYNVPGGNICYYFILSLIFDHRHFTGSKVYLAAKALGEMFEQLLLQAFDKSNNRPPSVEDYLFWADSCFRLNHEELGKVLNLLDNICPSALSKDTQSNEVLVNIDLLSTSAYHESLSLISSFLPDAEISLKRERSEVKARDISHEIKIEK
jgi:hypothetical protein